MRFKCDMDLVNPEGIIIRDVFECEERLLEKYTKREGTRVEKHTNCDSFFAWLKKSIKDGYITKLVHVGDTYKMLYLERDGGLLNSREIEFDLSEVPQSFKSKLDELEAFYQKKKQRLNKKTVRLLQKEGNPYDTLVECYTKFLRFCMNKQGRGNISIENYRCLFENQDLLKAAPLTFNTLESWRKKIYLLFSIVFALTFAWFGSQMPFIPWPFIFISWVGVMGVVARMEISEIKSERSRGFDTFLTAVERTYGKYYSQLLKNSQNKGFVDFIKSDLEYADEMSKERFMAAAEIYSKERAREFFEDGKVVDRYAYIMRLLYLEREMLETSKQTGALSEFKVNTDMLKERLKFLGWTEEMMKEDEFIKMVVEAINKVSAMTYSGVGIQLLDLIKLAVQYTQISPSNEESIHNMPLLCGAIVAEAHVLSDDAARAETSLQEQETIGEDLSIEDKEIENGRQIVPIMAISKKA